MTSLTIALTETDIGAFAEGYTPQDVNRWASRVYQAVPAVSVSAVWECYDGEGHHGGSELIVRADGGPWCAIGDAWWAALLGVDGASPAGTLVPVFGEPLPVGVFEWGGNYLYVDPAYVLGICLPPPHRQQEVVLPAASTIADTTEWFDSEDAARSVLADRGPGAVLFRVPRPPSAVVVARVLPDGDVEDVADGAIRATVDAVSRAETHAVNVATQP